jgi:hypothetical protein
VAARNVRMSNSLQRQVETLTQSAQRKEQSFARFFFAKLCV